MLFPLECSQILLDHALLDVRALRQFEGFNVFALTALPTLWDMHLALDFCCTANFVRMDRGLVFLLMSWLL